MDKKNERRAVVLSSSQLESLDKYAASKHITKSEAIRQFIDKGLAIETYEQNQTEIRKYIREEIENVVSIVMKQYMDRLIKMQAVATRTSSAALLSTISVLSENYIDQATPEEILANALRQSNRITHTKAKSDEEYLAEAHEWLHADLKKSNDS